MQKKKENKKGKPKTKSDISNKPKNVVDNKNKRNRYNLQFENETKEEIQERIASSRNPIIPKQEIECEIDIENIFPDCHDILLPKRPNWSYEMSKEELEAKEEKKFQNYIQILKSQPFSDRLTHYEHNLETWRQLWRVLERSDIVTLITDSRFPVLHFVPSLYYYVTKELKKPFILILNKVDVAIPEVVFGWKVYFESKYPGLKVLIFSSFPKDPEEQEKNRKKIMSKARRKKGGFIPFGSKSFLEACQSIYPNKDFSQWKKKIENETLDRFDEEKTTEYNLKTYECLMSEWDTQKSKFLTIGLVGFPNVGKSSFLNGIKGSKVASVSKTPGHTKYFQTIFITNDVVLCDCPGLVFPSLMEKQWQILSGIFPLSQVKEPYTSIGYIAERVDLVKLLNLKPVSNDQEHWSAWTICEAWAKLRGFHNAKSSRYDVYRAANHILRLTTLGKVGIYLLPPKFHIMKDQFKSEPETLELYDHLKKYSNIKIRYSNDQDSIKDQLPDEDTENRISNRFSALDLE